jgi:hypothetical protein
MVGTRSNPAARGLTENNTSTMTFPAMVNHGGTRSVAGRAHRI